MAVTIESSPQLYTPSDNPVTWRFSSTETAQANFSYLVELYINTVLDSRHLIFPEVGIYAHFDASEMLKASCAVAQYTDAVVSNASNIKTAYIKVIERYGDPVANGANASSSTINVFKACLSNADFIAWDYTDYLVGSIAGLYLTNFDRLALKLKKLDSFFLQIITNSQALDLRIRYYNSVGTLVYTETFAIANTIKIAQFNLNSSLINDTIDTATFVVDILNGATVYCEPITITRILADTCNIESQVTWLNVFGGFDQFTFLHNLTQKAKIKKLEYEKQFGSWVGNNFVYSTSNTGTTAYLKMIEDSGEIVSDWITEDIQNSVVALYESPAVTRQLTSNTYEQIIVENSSYEIKQEKYEDLFNEVVQYTKSASRKSILT